MSYFENIVNKWSHKVKSGMPDINNFGHKLVLRQVLLEEGWDIRSANTAYIYGYATRETLENTEVANFGEGLCRHYPLEKLQSIDKLLDKFNKNIYNTQTSFL